MEWAYSEMWNGYLYPLSVPCAMYSVNPIEGY